MGQELLPVELVGTPVLPEPAVSERDGGKLCGLRCAAVLKEKRIEESRVDLAYVQPFGDGDGSFGRYLTDRQLTPLFGDSNIVQ